MERNRGERNRREDEKEIDNEGQRGDTAGREEHERERERSHVVDADVKGNRTGEGTALQAGLEQRN
eukprot:4333142-Pleurochrysis_carterae.AAC.1